MERVTLKPKQKVQLTWLLFIREREFSVRNESELRAVSDLLFVKELPPDVLEHSAVVL